MEPGGQLGIETQTKKCVLKYFPGPHNSACAGGANITVAALLSLVARPVSASPTWMPLDLPTLPSHAGLIRSGRRPRASPPPPTCLPWSLSLLLPFPSPPLPLPLPLLSRPVQRSSTSP